MKKSLILLVIGLFMSSQSTVRAYYYNNQSYREYRPFADPLAGQADYFYEGLYSNSYEHKNPVRANPDFIDSTAGSIVGAPVGAAVGLYRGGKKKALAHSYTLYETMGEGAWGTAVGKPVGFVVGAVSGAVGGLVVGLLDGLAIGGSDPYSKESFSLEEEFVF